MITVLDRTEQSHAQAPASGDLNRLLGELDELAESSSSLIKKPCAWADEQGIACSLPRYIYLGPTGGGDTIRLGVFAAIHGDEPQSALAVARFAAALEKNPELATGYALFLYPVCNPTGFEDRTRWSRSGKDLNREFWRNSSEPEVRCLETEIWTHAFHGIVNLHSDDTSDGLYGFVNGEVLSQHLVEPALAAGEKYLPRNHARQIDGFRAERGIVYECYNGVLTAPAGLHHPPFEITLETPHHAPLQAQVNAFEAALETILAEYRSLISIAQGI